MTHGFDDAGCKYNADGNLEDWWTQADKEEYERRVQVMVD
jgi:predicted metalloendopeptidase